jgi:hypothetical protein
MQGTNGKLKHRVLTLAEARKAAPAVNAAEALRQNFQLVLLKSVSDLDVKAMVDALKKRAMEGDLKAMKMLLELLTGGGKGGAQMNQVIVVDNTGSPLPGLPTAAPPHSDAKIEAMARRAEMREAVFHPDDAGHGDGDDE